MTTADLTGALDTLDELGFVVLTGTIGPELVQGLVEEIHRLTVALDIKPVGTTFEGRNTTRIRNLLRHGLLARTLATNGDVRSLLDRYLGTDHLLSSITSLCIHPGEVAQPVHVDDLGIDLPRPRPPLECSVMVALTDYTADNGGTRVLPGSHRRDDEPPWTEEVEVPGMEAVEMSAGSVLVYNAGLWHGAGANRSATDRLGIGISYCRGWVRPHENPYLGLPIHVVAEFEPALRQLCGYEIFRNVINHVDGRQPWQYISETRYET